MRKSTPFLLLLVLLSLSGCEDDVNCVEMAGHPDCLPSCLEDPTLPGCDAFDLGTGDQGVPDDGGPCGMCGSGTVCDPAAGECVACLGDGDCTDGVCLVDEGDSSNNECVPCIDSDDCSEGVCDTDYGVCVECVADTDCTDPAMAKCDSEGEGATNTCVECDSSTQCEGTGENECVAGACVECTEASAESDCGDFSCNPATNECTETERDDVLDCGRCVSDTECMDPDARCVPMNYMGAARPDGYCLRQFSAGCSRPYGVLITAVSLSGEAEQQYCGIDQAATTCDAVRALIDSVECTDGDVSLCGDAGARCEMVGALANQCTYSCSAANECPASGPASTCAGDYCGS